LPVPGQSIKPGLIRAGVDPDQSGDLDVRGAMFASGEEMLVPESGGIVTQERQGAMSGGLETRIAGRHALETLFFAANPALIQKICAFNYHSPT